MIYEIRKDGETINTIVADETFVKGYCERNGYTYSEVERPEPTTPNAQPTTEERVTALEEALAQADEMSIELFEAMAAQEEINTAQDEALIDIYELIGG